MLGKSAFLAGFDDFADAQVWDDATNFSLSALNDIAMAIRISSERNGYGKAYLNYWRSCLMAEIARQKTKEQRLGINPVRGPLYLIEQRLPTEQEKKEAGFNVAARARALGFNEKIADTNLAFLIVKLSEFHRMVSIRFVCYDEEVYNALSQSTVTMYGADGSSKNYGRPAKARDWYDFFEREALDAEEKAKSVS